MKNLRRPPAGSCWVGASLASAIALILLAQLELGGSFRGLQDRSDACSSAAVNIQKIRRFACTATRQVDLCASLRWHLRRRLGLWHFFLLWLRYGFPAPGNDGGALQRCICGFWRQKNSREGLAKLGAGRQKTACSCAESNRELPQLSVTSPRRLSCERCASTAAARLRR